MEEIYEKTNMNLKTEANNKAIEEERIERFSANANDKNCNKEYPEYFEILRGRPITLRGC